MPRVVLPFVKVTWPVGVPEPGLLTVTVAVKVTGWPLTDGFFEDCRTVVVCAGATGSMTFVVVLML